jgi:putative proteasome-type protease
LRSNLSVGLPLDLLVYERDALRVTRYVSIDQDNEYYGMIHRTWGDRLRQVFGEIPDPDWRSADDVPHGQRARAPITYRGATDGEGSSVGAGGLGEHFPPQTLAQATKTGEPR